MLLYKAIGRRNAVFCIQAAPLAMPSLSPFILRLSPPLPKSFIAYPTLPTTCYTIPEDTQRGNLCPGIAAACEIRSRVRKSPCTRNAQCDPAYTRFRLAETLLSMDNSAVSLPPADFTSYITPSIVCKRVPFRNCAIRFRNVPCFPSLG